MSEQSTQPAPGADDQPTPGVNVEPSQVTSGATTETSEDNLIPPGAQAQSVPQEGHLERLEAFLAERFPHEVARTNRQQPEHPVDVAIRLLQGLHAHRPPTEVDRCPEPYCNQPEGHVSAHGWVHFG